MGSSDNVRLCAAGSTLVIFCASVGVFASITSAAPRVNPGELWSGWLLRIAQRGQVRGHEDRSQEMNLITRHGVLN